MASPFLCRGGGSKKVKSSLLALVRVPGFWGSSSVFALRRQSLNDLLADVPFLEASLDVNCQHDFKSLKARTDKHHLPQESFNPVTLLNTGFVPAT